MTSVRGVHGHIGYCACGWEGHLWKTPSKAQAEAKWHYWTDHSKEIAAHKREDESATKSEESF